MVGTREEVGIYTYTNRAWRGCQAVIFHVQILLATGASVWLSIFSIEVEATFMIQRFKGSSIPLLH